MKTLQPDVQLRLLGLQRLDDPKREIYRAHNGLFVKRRREPGKARQEFDATQLARFLLPDELEVSRSWGVVGDEYYVSEALVEKCTWRNPQHVDWAIDYLIALHRVEIDPQVQRDLIDAGYGHYLGETLRRRMSFELKSARRAFSRNGPLGRHVETFAELIANALARWSFDDDRVLGHGDFQKSNLYVRDGRIVPIDWTDFGVGDRAYDVMHLSQSLPPDHRETLLRRYCEATGSNAGALAARGGAIDAIVRAGGAARQSGEAGQDVAACTALFAKQVERGAAAFSN